MTVVEKMIETIEKGLNLKISEQDIECWIEMEKQQIIDALQHDTPFVTLKSGNYTADEFEDAFRKIQDDYYGSLKTK